MNWKDMKNLHAMASKFVKFWSSNDYIASVAVFILLASLYSLAYLSLNGILFSDDHFFHFKYAELIRTNDWTSVTSDFDWIYYSELVFGRDFPYAPSLYQAALIPFTYVSNKLLGLKLADIFFASASFSIVYYALRRMGVRYSLLWLFFLISVSFFATRMLSGRAYVLSIGLVFLELLFALEKKHWKFFAVSLLHTFWHQSTFFMPLIIAMIVECARYVGIYRYYTKNILWGVIAVIPAITYFPGLLHGLFVAQGGATKENVAGQGIELYTVDIYRILQDSPILLFLTLFGIMTIVHAYISQKKAQQQDEIEKEDQVLDAPGIVVLYASFFLLLMTFAGTMIASGRFYDYYFPSATLLGAVAVQYFYDKSQLTIGIALKKLFLLSAIIFLLVAVADSMFNIRQNSAKSNHGQLGAAAEWIKEKSKDKDLVFLADWSYFPISFFYNTKNVYTMGIEPQAIRSVRPDLYWKWYNIFYFGIHCELQRDCADIRKKIDEKIADISKEDGDMFKKDMSRKIIESIRSDFGSRFVLAPKELSDIISLNSDMVSDMEEFKSNFTGKVYTAIELK